MGAEKSLGLPWLTILFFNFIISFSILARDNRFNCSDSSMPGDCETCWLFSSDLFKRCLDFGDITLDCNNDGEEKEESMEDVESLDRFWDMGVIGFLKALACLIASNFIPCLNSSIRPPKAEDTRSLLSVLLDFQYFRPHTYQLHFEARLYLFIIFRFRYRFRRHLEGIMAAIC